MAGLLHAAKWIRSAVCAPPGAADPPVMDELPLQPLGLHPHDLDTIAEAVRHKLASLSSMLDSVRKPMERPQFPAQSWRP
jgi:hypothetical protein